MSPGDTIYCLEAVWGSSANNGFAVGAAGTIIHYDGSRWSTMTSGASNTLNDVWGTARGDVFAVGDYGNILFYGELSAPLPFLPLLLLNE